MPSHAITAWRFYAALMLMFIADAARCLFMFVAVILRALLCAACDLRMPIIDGAMKVIIFIYLRRAWLFRERRIYVMMIIFSAADATRAAK